MCIMAVSGPAPCQCFSPGAIHTVSPGRISRTGPPQSAIRPSPFRRPWHDFRRRRSLAMQRRHATPAAENRLGNRGGAGMKILLLGSGGREHALAWKLSASPLVDRLYCAPGNAGIARECELVAVDPADHASVISFAQSHRIGLVVVGPETPLCAGIVDALAAAGVKAFGPTRA